MSKYTETPTQGIVVMSDTDNDIRYLMIGVLIDKKFSGLISDYTGGGEYTEYYFMNGEMVEDADDISDALPVKLIRDIDEFMTDNDIDLDDVGNYIYTGAEDLGKGVITSVHPDIEEEDRLVPIEVGNTIFTKEDEDISPSEVEFNVLQNQPEFSSEESDWWHGYTIRDGKFDVHYLDDDGQNIYVYEVVDGVRNEHEFMIIPVRWEFDTATNKYNKIEEKKDEL